MDDVDRTLEGLLKCQENLKKKIRDLEEELTGDPAPFLEGRIRAYRDAELMVRDIITHPIMLRGAMAG